jgi:hypothetical protein
VPEPPLTIARARRREATAASHLGAVPRCVLPGVRTPSTPASFCPKVHVTVPRRAREQISGEPHMEPLRRAYASPPSAGFDVSHPLIDGGSGLDRRYPFVLIKFNPPELKSMPEIELLCRGLMSRNHGSVP